MVFINCANRGTPDGGPKDLNPPVIIKTEPENYSTHFNSKEIRIYFDEYIKLKDLQKQLIISPPMNIQPEITPLGSASKYITIKIFDTLQPNTTYAFNFGNSIQDNNEGNPYTFYRYVFSTGDYIDSLTVKGNITDAIKREPETFVSVMLYEVDSTFNDSIIYKKVPKYITNTLDSLTSFTIENVKAGKYMLLALKDKNNDNKFQQKTDKIGFYKSFIDVPTDSLYSLKLFNEDIDFKAVRPRLESGEKIVFGYEGDFKGINIHLKSEVPSNFKHRITKDEKTDTLYYWYKPKLEADSLIFNVSKLDFNQDFTVKIKDNKKDTLVINASPSSNIEYKQPFKIFGSTPFETFDPSKVEIIDKDSTKIDFNSTFDTITNTYTLDFEKKEDNAYKITVLPEALVDFFGNKNDTLRYSLKTQKKDSYGNLRVHLKNAIYPVIVQLTDAKGDVKYEMYATKQEPLDFLNISPSKYFIRIIFDTNGNKKYDTGNYLKKILPERISNFEMSDAIRADWSYEETLELLSEKE